jgi:hypothetical protein
MQSKKRIVVLLLILSSIALMLLTQIFPHWTVAQASYQVTVRSRQELSNVTVWAQTYGSFDTLIYAFDNKTADADYAVKTNSGKIVGPNITVTTLTLIIRSLRAGGSVNVTFPLVPLGRP